VLDRRRRDGIEYPIWSAVHGMAVLAGQGPLRDLPAATRKHFEDLTRAFIGESLESTRLPGALARGACRGACPRALTGA